MLVSELKSSQRHPPSPKELGGTEVKSRIKAKLSRIIFDRLNLISISVNVANSCTVFLLITFFLALLHVFFIRSL